MGLFDRALASTVPILPRGAVHLVARRYIAGETLEDALACVRSLNAEGALATIDILGENVDDAASADRTRDEYVSVLAALAGAGLEGNVSVKLTALGLARDAAACERRVATICDEAASRGTTVTIDMEDSSVTDATLDLYERVHAERANVGPVLQAYLHRTIADARRIAGPDLRVRLCKGIYVEPRTIAWKDRDAIRGNFTWALEELLKAGSTVGVATHDELLVWEALRLKDELSVPDERFEFQMLLGVEEDLRRTLLGAGHRVRVYVPFGEHWHAYSVRRLRENPEIAGHVAKATMGRILGGGSKGSSSGSSIAKK